MVTFLSGHSPLPDPRSANSDGLVAIGGELTVQRLVEAYSNGIFPWPLDDEAPITWFSPTPRAILEFDKVHVSRSLRRTLNKNWYTITFDRAFAKVIDACAESNSKRPNTWITEEMKFAYLDLHAAGHAHSVEVWDASNLVGGLYGVQVGGLFSGESMFSTRSDTSKIAVLSLVQRLQEKGFLLFDIQQETPHMLRMGATTLSRDAYLRRVAEAVQQTCTF